MNRMYGADIEQLRHLAAEFDRAAARLEQDRSLVSRWIQLPAWLGPDAQRFRNVWDSEHSQVLNAVVVRLREVASELHRNTTEQQDASAADESGRLFSEKHWSHVGTGGINQRPDPYGFLKRSENLLNQWDAMSDAEKRALDPNQLIHTYGSLDGLPARVRDEANRIALEAFMLSPCPAEPPEAIADYQRKMTAYSQIVQTLEQHPDAQLLVLRPDGGSSFHVAISLGDVDTAENVSIYTQGWKSGADKENGLLDPVQQLDSLRLQIANQAQASKEEFATVLWMGYDAPQGNDFDVGVNASFHQRKDEFAERGAEKLASFAQGIKSHNPNSRINAVGHSYGSLVSGIAAQQTDAFHSLIVFGSPGIGTDDLSKLKLSGDLYVAAFPNDIAHFSWGHGLNPSLFKDKVSIDVGVELTVNAHSDYLNNGSTSQINIAKAIAEQTHRTRYPSGSGGGW